MSLPTPTAPPRSYGPLSLAVAPLLGAPPAPGAPAGDAASQLGRLLDFHGSVELAAIVGAPLVHGDARPLTAAELEHLRSELIEDLAEVRAQLAHGVSRWTAQKSRVAGPEALAMALASRAALGPRERRTTTLATDIWRPIAEEMTKELAHARRAVRRLRLELEPSLVVMGPRAARLCELNHTLSEALEPAVQARMERLVSAAEAHLAKELASFISAVPAGDVAPVVAAWLSHEGPIRRGIALMSRIARAVLEIEERRVLALLDAVADAARSDQSVVFA